MNFTYLYTCNVIIATEINLSAISFLLSDMNSEIASTALFLIWYLLSSISPFSLLPSLCLSLLLPIFPSSHLSLLRAALSGSVLPFVLLPTLTSTCANVCGHSWAPYSWFLNLITHYSRFLQEPLMGSEPKHFQRGWSGVTVVGHFQPSVFERNRPTLLLMNEQHSDSMALIQASFQIWGSSVDPSQPDSLDVSTWHWHKNSKWS